MLGAFSAQVTVDSPDCSPPKKLRVPSASLSWLRLSASGPARLVARLPAVIGSRLRSNVSRKSVPSRSRTVVLVVPAYRTPVWPSQRTG